MSLYVCLWDRLIGDMSSARVAGGDVRSYIRQPVGGGGGVSEFRSELPRHK